MKKTYYINPQIDYLIIFVGGDEIPTKQDDYVPVNFQDENGEIIKEFYKRKADNSSVKKFREKVIEFFKEQNISIINKPDLIEIFISVSTKSINRFNQIDVDNISKNVVDSLKGFAFEDDSQITNLVCNKTVDQNNDRGLIIAVTNLKNCDRGLSTKIKLFSDDEKYFE